MGYPEWNEGGRVAFRVEGGNEGGRREMRVEAGYSGSK